MSRFDVYAAFSKGPAAYLLDVQADFLRDLRTRVVVPLLSTSIVSKPAGGLNPSFGIGGERYIMVTQSIAAVPSNRLRTPVLSLLDRSDDIMRALDMLLVGF